MDPLALIGGNHIYRYSFTLGLVILIFAIVYPMQMKNDLELERVRQYEDLAVLKIEIEDLDAKATELAEISKNLKSEPKLTSKRFNKRVEVLKEVKKFSTGVESLAPLAKSVKIKNAKIDMVNMRIDTLQSQVNSFNVIANFMIIFGIILSIFGFGGWLLGSLGAKPRLDKG